MILLPSGESSGALDYLLDSIRQEGSPRPVSGKPGAENDGTTIGEVIGGLAARWQKITSGFRYRTRELATMVHSQTVEKTTDILRRFFGELQEGWLDVPEFLYLPAEAEKKYIELLELIKEN